MEIYIIVSEDWYGGGSTVVKSFSTEVVAKNYADSLDIDATVIKSVVNSLNPGTDVAGEEINI